VGLEKYVDLDPHFPNRLLSYPTPKVITFLQSLLEKYSTLYLSKSTDRAVAISGLMNRIGSTLQCEQRYGVLEQFIHRTVLWSWAGPREGKIDYEDDKIPSWSWMGYEGGIRFRNSEYRNFRLYKKLQFERDRKALFTDVWELQDCHLQEDLSVKPPETRYQIRDLSGEIKGWVMYDVGDDEGPTSELAAVVVVGCSEDDLHFLAVRWVVEGEYERLGIGVVQKGCVSLKGTDIMIV